MKILCRNVNGIRAVHRKGLTNFLADEIPDILCLQETKAFEHQLPKDLSKRLTDHDYKWCWHAGQRAGYAGTAIFWRTSIDDVVSCSTFADRSKFDEDGRVTQIQRDYPAAPGGE
jgi:exodeoxyribonuclease-3